MRPFKLLAIALLLLPGMLWAQSGALDSRTFKKLNQAQELAGAERFDEALEILDGMKDSTRLNSYGRSQVWNFYAFIFASQDRFDDAIDAYAKVLAEPDATEGLRLTAKYTTAQIYFQQEKYADCIRVMREWLATTDTPTPTAHIMLAQAYYQTEDHAQGLPHVDAAIAMEREVGKRVQESWLRLKAALHYSSGDFAGTAAVYEILADNYPKLSYLRQLAGMYSELGRPEQRLAVFDAAYEHGALDSESELLNLAYMWQGLNVPYKAGRIIEQGMQAGIVEESQDNINSLANAWAQANEYKKAIPALTQAAERSDDGRLYARLAGVYFNAGEYAQAAEAAQQADARGGLKNPAGNRMLMGMAQFNSKQFEAALQSFRQAKRDKDSYTFAAKWEKYTLGELERLRALEQSRQELYWKTFDALEATENNQEAPQLSEERLR